MYTDIPNTYKNFVSRLRGHRQGFDRYCNIIQPIFVNNIINILNDMCINDRLDDLISMMQVHRYKGVSLILLVRVMKSVRAKNNRK